jgi:hypothetical protein
MSPSLPKSNKDLDGYVDAAGIGGRLFILPGEISFLFKLKEKLAEVIVVVVSSVPNPSIATLRTWL